MYNIGRREVLGLQKEGRSHPWCNGMSRKEPSCGCFERRCERAADGETDRESLSLCWPGGVAEDLSAVLAGGCPGFFKEDDKTFYAASGLLQRAEATTAPAERAHLTREALRLMMKVCGCLLTGRGHRKCYSVSKAGREAREEDRRGRRGSLLRAGALPCFWMRWSVGRAEGAGWGDARRCRCRAIWGRR